MSKKSLPRRVLLAGALLLGAAPHLFTQGLTPLAQLSSALTSANNDTRLAAVVELVRLGPDASAATPDLSRTLFDPDNRVRFQTTQALGRIGAEARGAALDLEKALSDPDHDVRQGAAWALGKIGTDARAAAPGLLRTLKDRDPGVRRTAAWALVMTGAEPRAATPVLIEALADRDPAARQSATRALGRPLTDTALAVPALLAQLNDENSEVRRLAAASLTAIAERLDTKVPDHTRQLSVIRDALAVHPDVDVKSHAISVEALLIAAATPAQSESGLSVPELIGLAAGVTTIVAFMYIVAFGNTPLPTLVRNGTKSLYRAGARLRSKGEAPDTGTVLVKVLYRLTCIDCNPQGTHLVFGGFSGDVLLFDLQTRTVTTIGKHPSVVRQVRFSPDGLDVVSVGDDGLIRLTTPSTRQFRTVGRHVGAVYDVDVSKDGTKLASVGANGVASLWHARSAPLQEHGTDPSKGSVPIRTIRRTDAILFGITFHPAQKSVAICGTKGVAEIVSLNRGIKKLSLGSGTFFSATFSPGGKTLAVTSDDGMLRLVDSASGHVQVLPGHTAPIRSARFDRLGSQIITGSKDRTVRVWNVETGTSRLFHGPEDYVYGVAFHPSGESCFAVGGDGALRQWLLSSAIPPAHGRAVAP